jgi:hypothetical protein
MRTLLAYIVVLPLSFLASRLGAIVAGGPIAFALSRTSVWLRSTIAGFVGCVGGVVAAVVFGWCVFSWVVGPGSFTLAPFLASVLLLTISIPKDFSQAKNRTQTGAELQTSGQRWLANEIGNPWSTVVGDVCGLILATAWFFWHQG